MNAAPTMGMHPAGAPPVAATGWRAGVQALDRWLGWLTEIPAPGLVLPHPSSGTLILEAPLSKEMKAGFARFGFDEHEADPEPFRRGPRR